jgi:hypothetical protein
MEAANKGKKLMLISFKVIFNEGDEVLLSTKNIKIKMKGTPKLLPKWLEPFKVIKIIISNAYKSLQLPDSLKIHHVFHVSLLKPYPSGILHLHLLKLSMMNLSMKFESILDHEDKVLRRKRNMHKTHVYVL